MVSVNDSFPTKYLAATDLAGKVALVTIAHVDREEVGKSKDIRLVAYFKGKQKGMVLNKTNAKTIADAFGDETDNWTGAEIEVFSMKVEYQGRMVDGIRLRIPQQSRQGNGNSQPRQGNVEFVKNARDDDRLRQGQTPQAKPPNPGNDDLDDEIPF